MKKKTTEGKELVQVPETNNVPSQMIQLAVSKGADLDKLEKLLTLQERWETNEAKKAYNKAMAEFKVNPPKIGKDRKVGYKTGAGRVDFSHASLYNVTEKINIELSKYGLSASWKTKQDGNIIVTCKITHIKGHSEKTSLSAQADTSGSKNAIQAIGSTITYLERYTLLALTGLATFDQDDNGKSAIPIECIDENQQHEILVMITDKNVNMDKFCKAFGIEELSQLPKNRYNQAIIALEAKKVSK